MERVELYAAQVGNPQHVGYIGRGYEADGLSLGSDGNGRHPLGCVRRRILLVEKITCYPVGHALEGERTPFEMRQHQRRDAEIIGKKIGLGEALLRPVDFFQIREAQPLASGTGIPVFSLARSGEIGGKCKCSWGSHWVSMIRKQTHAI
jgi:hypothetical protein